MTRAEGEAGPRHVLLGVLALALALGIAELGVRVIAPPPRVQVVRRSAHTELLDIDGVPVWFSPRDSEDRWNFACAQDHPDSRGVVVVGSSIFYGVSLPADQTFGALLQRRLDADPPPGRPVCVHNLAQPAFSFEQKLAVATHWTGSATEGTGSPASRSLAPPLRPAVYLWELWGPDPAEYTWAGPGTAIRMGSLQVGPDGLPNPLQLPPAVNRWLLSWSTLWLHVDVGLSPARERDARSPWRRVIDEELPRLLRLVQAQGARLVLLTAPPLHQGFPQSLQEAPEQVSLLAPVAAIRADVDLVRLERLLVDDEVTALRLDTCCHFNAAGHRRLAEAIDPLLRRALAGQPVTDDADPGPGDPSPPRPPPTAAPTPPEAPTPDVR